MPSIYPQLADPFGQNSLRLDPSLGWGNQLKAVVVLGFVDAIKQRFITHTHWRIKHKAAEAAKGGNWHLFVTLVERMM